MRAAISVEDVTLSAEAFERCRSALVKNLGGMGLRITSESWGCPQVNFRMLSKVDPENPEKEVEAQQLILLWEIEEQEGVVDHYSV